MSFNTPGSADVVDVFGGGTSTQITLPVVYNQINSGSIDPVTGELWFGGIAGSAGVVSRHTLLGLAAVTSTTVANTGAGLSLKSIDFDRNGDVFTCDTGTIYKVERSTGIITPWDTDTYFGSFNGLCIDLENDLMWVVTFSDGAGSELIEYDLTAGPGPGTVLYDFVVGGFQPQLSGIDDDGQGTLYVVNWDVTGASVVSYDTGTGQAQVVAGSPPVGLNDVWWDRRNGILHVIGNGATEDYWTLDLAGTATQITFGASVGAPANVAVNDFIDRTEVFPQRPVAALPFLLESAAHGNAGEFAGTAVIAVNGIPLANPIILGLGVCDSGGFFTSKLSVAAGTLSPGDSIIVASARLDTASGAVVFAATSHTVIFQ